MKNMSCPQPLRASAHLYASASCRTQCMQEQALEDLIAVLEMAALEQGWTYRPSRRDSSSLPSLAARLRAAHAAYTLASTHIQRNTLGRTSPGPDAISSPLSE